MNNIFGSFPGVEDLFKKWITDSHFSIHVAIDGEKLIGISSWHIKQDNNFDKFISFGENAIQHMKGKKTAWILNLAIDSEYRKLGLGSKLASSHLEWLKKSNCDLVMGTSWVSGSDDNSRHLYEKAGFQRIAESSVFLRGQMQNGAICSACKSTECNCKSILFSLDLKSNELFNGTWFY